MRRSNPSTPALTSFVKILITRDYTRRLRLPSDYVVKYKSILPTSAKLGISNSEETWTVKIENLHGDEYYFTRGWTQFVTDLELEMFEVLVFRPVGRSRFEVRAYDVNGSRKELLVSNRHVGNSDCDAEPNDYHGHDLKNKLARGRAVETEDADETDCSPNTNPRFNIVLLQHRRARVCVPRSFAEATGLIRKQKVAMEYYPRGHKVNVALDKRSMKPHFKMDMAKGWAEFRKKNCLVYGKMYSLEFIPSKQVIQVKEIDQY